VIQDEKELARIRTALLMIAGCSWALLIAGPDSLVWGAHCSTATDPTSLREPASVFAIAMSPSAIFGWMLMLLAMMLPALVSPIYHVWNSSFVRRRLRSVALFLGGYCAVWIVACVLLIIVERLLAGMLHQAYLSLTLVSLFAVVWQFSPAKQKSLNRCHSHGDLAVFGMAAYISSFRLGITHGIWCVHSCWILMLCSVLVPKGHLLAMMIVAILLFCERLERPQPPSWRVRGFGRVLRMVIARARIYADERRLRVTTS